MAAESPLKSSQFAASFPPRAEPLPAPSANEAYLVASGDLRLSANQTCWPEQHSMEQKIIEAFAREGVKVIRAHPYDPELKHGFIWNQRMGMQVFKGIHPDARVIVAEAVWQYSYHVLGGLHDHRGPVLTVANWSGKWPGLVGLLNLNASLTKMGKEYGSVWSENFDDEFFLEKIREWIKTGKTSHNTAHVRDLQVTSLPGNELELGTALARHLRSEKAILGIFDEGCMGMYNAIFDDDLLNNAGIYKERLSQSALVAAMKRVPDSEAAAVRRWLDDRGLTFQIGKNPDTDLTNEQIHEQLKMYIAAVRIAAAFGCDAIGIQYQQGLKDTSPASDLAEGLMNNVERPPVFSENEPNKELFAGQPVVHFNEVDQGAAVDALVTNRVWTALGFDPATTLHDIRWGEHYHGNGVDAFVWVFEISGSAPASHFIGGYRGAVSERQPPMYFPLGGGTLKGISKPGEIVWSRVWSDGRGGTRQLHADLGRATIVELPQEETQRRWESTTPQWPIMHAVLHGVNRDQMMARHRSNHVQVAYAPSGEAADAALRVKAAMFAEMGIVPHVCGKVNV